MFFRDKYAHLGADEKVHESQRLMPKHAQAMLLVRWIYSSERLKARDYLSFHANVRISLCLTMYVFAGESDVWPVAGVDFVFIFIFPHFCQKIYFMVRANVAKSRENKAKNERQTTEKVAISPRDSVDVLFFANRKMLFS